jgi:uncharacterized cupredoxin-like copper-binding protein
MCRTPILISALLILVMPVHLFADEGGHTEKGKAGHDDSMPQGMMHDGEEMGMELRLGHPGDARMAKQRVDMDMNDTFAFTPGVLRIERGSTVRLIFHNRGKVLHEWILGTPEKIEEHAELMRRFPSMQHDEPQQVRVPPGEKRELVWQFDRPGTFLFACLQPGHYEAGMHGTVEVK